MSKGTSQRIAPPRGPFSLRICAGCGQQIHDGHHSHGKRLAPVYEVNAVTEATLNDAREALHAAIEDYAELLRAHTRAIWALNGEVKYPKRERSAMGRRAQENLAAMRDALGA